MAFKHIPSLPIAIIQLWTLTLPYNRGNTEDFEAFLEKVKTRSLAARTRAISSQVAVDQQSTSSVTSKDRTDDNASSLDLEWEHEAGAVGKSNKTGLKIAKIEQSSPLQNCDPFLFWVLDIRVKDDSLLLRTGMEPISRKELQQMHDQDELKMFAELAVRPSMLQLKDTNTHSDYPQRTLPVEEFEWDSDLEISTETLKGQGDENVTLLTSSTRKPKR